MVAETQHVDLIVVGAGLVGSSLVLALQHQGLNIALLDQRWLAPTAAGGRPLSLAYGSVAIFRTLGVWSRLASHATPIHAVDVSEQGAFGAVHFRAADYGVDALGQVVPFETLSATLQTAALQQTGVQRVSVKALHEIGTDAQGRWLEFTEESGHRRRLCAPLLVGADGSASRVRELLQISVQRTAAAKVAAFGTLCMSQPQPGVALERFGQDDVLAVLPATSAERSGFVITMTTAQWQERSAWDASAWQAYCQQYLGQRVGRLSTVSLTGSYALETVVAEEPVVPGAVLLGNAAHTLYPLAAQGFNLGLRDAAALAEVLVAAREQGASFGELSVLQRYQQWRATDQKQVMRLTNNLARGFAWQGVGLKPLRGLALLAVDVVTPLKRRLAQLAMGISGRQPRLMRGLRLSSAEASHATD